MTTKHRLDREWYARRIQETLDDDFVIGPAAFPADEQLQRPPLTAAFGSLVRLARRSKRMNVEEFAKRLTVEATEIQQIEADPAYRARPRTISNFAKFFELPVTEVMKLAGAAVSNEDAFGAQAAKFAAHSDDISALTEDEQVLLQSFIRFLRAQD